MTWLQRHRARTYVRDSIWVLPIIAMALAMIAVPLLHDLEEAMGWQSDLEIDTARSVVGTLSGAIFTFIVFVCSSLLLVVQLASAQLTPRIIGILFRDRVTKLTLAYFVFTFAFSIATLVRIGPSVPLLTTRIAAYNSAVALAVFIYLIDHVGKTLRPSGALKIVAAEAHIVIDRTYPRKIRPQDTTIRDSVTLDPATCRTVKSHRGGVVLAFDVRGLVALGQRHDCFIELVPQVGNFVAPGNPLFRVHGGHGLADTALLRSVAFGSERTVEQDPTFALRVIVDIASKGLSPAINDPTTAVLAIDRIHHLLRHIGGRCLDDERLRDASGRVRLAYRTPDWEDFVTLSVTEIRHFGSSSIQVLRRLRAMLEDLIKFLPPDRAPTLNRELVILGHAAIRSFPEPEDLALAGISDAQGVGGTRESNQGSRGSEPRLESPFPAQAIVAANPSETPGGLK